MLWLRATRFVDVLGRRSGTDFTRSVIERVGRRVEEEVGAIMNGGSFPLF